MNAVNVEVVMLSRVAIYSDYALKVMFAVLAAYASGAMIVFGIMFSEYFYQNILVSTITTLLLRCLL